MTEEALISQLFCGLTRFIFARQVVFLSINDFHCSAIVTPLLFNT